MNVTVYMLAGVWDDGRIVWYKSPHHWVDQNEATVWTNDRAPANVKGSFKAYAFKQGLKVPRMKIVPFHLTPLCCEVCLSNVVRNHS